PREINLIVDYWRRATMPPPWTDTQQYNADEFRALIQRTEAFGRVETRRQTMGVIRELLGEQKEKEKPASTPLPLAPEPEQVPFATMVIRYMIYRMLFEQQRECGEDAALPEDAEQTLAGLRDRIRAYILHSPGGRALDEYVQIALRAYVK